MIYSQNRGLKSKVSLILLANFVVERVNTQKIFETIARLKLTLHGGSIKLEVRVIWVIGAIVLVLKKTWRLG